MEITCNRCHQAVLADNTYCATCGLPQLVYERDETASPAQPDRWTEVVRDASSVEWRYALRMALMLGLPAGLLSSGVSPLAPFGILWITSAAGWAVSLYLRKQRPGWITLGGGARIGLVTGLLAFWLAFAASGIDLAARRYLLGQGPEMDKIWESQVDAGVAKTQDLMTQLGTLDKAQLAWQRQFELSAPGHAGMLLIFMLMGGVFVLLLAAASGAISARLMAHAQRPRA